MGPSLLKAWPCVMALIAGSVQIRPSTPPPDRPVSLRVDSIDGAALRPLEPPGVAGAIFFIATDCPISNGYAPEIQRLCGAYASRGIGCTLIYEDPGVTAAAVRTHLDEYRYRGVPAAIDRDGALAARVRATITPEAVLVDRMGEVRYRGRIDNFYAALGRPRQAVTAHDLQDALQAMVDGRAVARPDTEPIGCYIVPSNLRRN